MKYILLFVVGSWVHSTSANAAARKPVEARKPPVKLKITISKATTYFTKPVRRDGGVDYIEALNRHHSKGVTAKNNAAVLILRAFGPKYIRKSLRAETYRRLDMRPLPSKGDYYAFPQFSSGPRGERDRKQWMKQFDRAIARPWKDADCPLIAKWLVDQAQVMKLLDQAARCEKFYLPFVASDPASLVIEGLDLRLPVFQHYRASARIFAIRANHHIAAGRIDAARRDLMTIHLLARQLDGDGFLIGTVVAYALDAVASSGDMTLASSKKLTSKQALGHRIQLDRIGPLSSLPAALNGGERCVALDFVLFVMRAAARSANDAGQLENLFPKGVAKRLHTHFGIYFDVEAILKLVNRRFDEQTRIAAIKDSHKRRAQAAKFEKQMKLKLKQLKQVPRFLRIGLPDKTLRAAASRWFAETLFAQFQPAVAQVIEAEDRTNVRFDLARAALALAAYRADHKAYPADLKSLLPKYLSKVPLDRFSGKPLRYKREKAGYRLYSNGPNAKDDGSSNSGDSDDIAVRAAE